MRSTVYGPLPGSQCGHRVKKGLVRIVRLALAERPENIIGVAVLLDDVARTCLWKRGGEMRRS